MNQQDRINYVEFPAADLSATKKFFQIVFNWAFTEYGPDYMDSPDGGIMTGFFKSNLRAKTDNGSVLVAFYSADLEATLAKIEAAGGKIIKPIFSFPGGRRFQFTEPSGNELAVWSDAEQ